MESFNDLIAFCVGCRQNRPMNNVIIKTTDSGRRMAQDRCHVCGTKINRILGRAKDER